MRLVSTMNFDCLDPNTLDKIATFDTTTASALRVTIEEVIARGGLGNMIQEIYNHSAEFALEANTTDIKMEYLAMKIGSEITYGDDVWEHETIEITGNKGVITGDIVKFKNQLVAWVRPEGSEDLPTKVTVDEATKEFSYVAENGTKLCVEYFIENDSATKVIVATNFVPKVMQLVGTIQAIEDGEDVGYFLVKIPKFRLDPGFELSLSADGFSEFSFSGKALAVKPTSCDQSQSYYATITFVPKTKKWQDDCKRIYASPYKLDLEVGEKEYVEVGASYKSSASDSIIKPKYITYSIPVESAGVATVDEEGNVEAIGAGSAKLHISVTGYPELADDVDIIVTD